MTDQAELALKPEVVLIVGPGEGRPERLMRVSREHVSALRKCLTDQGLRISLPPQVTNTFGLIQMVTVAVSSGGAVTALVVGLQKFFESHKDRKVLFGPNGEVKSITGYSARAVERVLDAADRAQHEKNKTREASQRESRIGSGETEEDASAS